MHEVIDPLLQLRGDWRQAAAITIPTAVTEVVPLLDRALDLLEQRGQLNEPSLAMAIDVICNALPGRPDEIRLLRVRLGRAAHDYATTSSVGSDGYGGADLSSSAFDDEEALAAALFAVGEGSLHSEETPSAPPAVAVIDRRTLQRRLSNRPSAARRLLTWGGAVAGAVLVAGGAFWIAEHPPDFLVQRAEPAPPSAMQAPISTGRSGTFQSGTASCPGGTASPSQDACLWPFVATSDGQLRFTLSWTPTTTPLELQVVDASTGTPIGSSTAGTSGQAMFNGVAKAGATYHVIVTNSSRSSLPVAFTLTSG